MQAPNEMEHPMYPGAIRAYFYVSQDARRAMNALEAINATVSPPEPVQPPQNGRAWVLTIEPSDIGLSPLFQDPVLLNQVTGIITRYNGITDVAHATL